MNDVWPGHVLPRAAPFEHARRAREEPQLVDHRRDLVGGHQRLGLAGAPAFGVDEPRRVGLDRVRDAQQRANRSDGVVAAQPSKAAAAAADRVVDVGRARAGRGAVLDPGARVDERRGGAVAGLDLLAVDEIRNRRPSGTSWTAKPSIRGRRAARGGRSSWNQRSADEIRTSQLSTSTSLAIIRELQADGRRSVHGDRQHGRAVGSRGAATACNACSTRGSCRSSPSPTPCASGSTAKR